MDGLAVTAQAMAPTEAVESSALATAPPRAAPAGHLHVWGANHLGQAGSGPGPDVLLPRPVPGLPAISAASCNANSALALDQAGRVWSWGWDVGGSLGRPAPIGKRVSLLDGSEESSAARRTSTPPFATPGQLWNLPPIKQVALGAENGLALDGEGRIWAWGGPACLGRPDAESGQQLNSRPARVEGMPAIRSLACDPAGMAAYAVDREGGLWSWGMGQQGELGRGKARFDPLPGRVQDLGTVRSVHAGAAFCLALLDDGSVWGWGLIGIGAGPAFGARDAGAVESPTRIAGLGDVQALWLGGDMAIVRTCDGETFSLGSSHVLAPHEAPSLASTLRRRPVLDPYRRFTLGRHHGFGIDAWGHVIGFGHAVHGALGNGLNQPDLKLGPTRLDLRSLPLAAAGHYSLGLQ